MPLATQTPPVLPSFRFHLGRCPRPQYRNKSDGFLAVYLSLSLALLFLTCIFYKLASLTELGVVQVRIPMLACARACTDALPPLCLRPG